MLFGGFSVVGAIRSLHKSNPGDADDTWHYWVLGVLFVVLYVWSFLLLVSSRNDALVLARRKAKDVTAKATKQTISEFVDGWFKAFAINTKALLPDLIRRLRSELERPHASHVSSWKVARAEADSAIESFEASAVALRKAYLEIESASKAVEDRSASIR